MTHRTDGTGGLVGQARERLGALIRARRGVLGLSLAQVAERAGCSRGYVSLIENGVKVNVSAEMAGAIEQALGLMDGSVVAAAAWERARAAGGSVVEREIELGRAARVDGEGEGMRVGGRKVGKDLDAMWRSGALGRMAGVDGGMGERADGKSGGGRGSAGAGFVKELGRVSGRVGVPIINRVAAGNPSEFTDLGYPVGAADGWLSVPGVSDADAFATVVTGDSMEPEYRAGDVVVFEPRRALRDGLDCFVRLERNGEATFKRVYFEKRGEEEVIRLEALNKKYAERVVAREAVALIAALGAVVRRVVE